MKPKICCVDGWMNVLIDLVKRKYFQIARQTKKKKKKTFFGYAIVPH